MAAWVLKAAAAALLVLAAGCLDPYRVHVDPAVLSRSLAWQERLGAETGAGEKAFLATYDVPAGAPAPAAHLEVYSLRGAAPDALADLLNRSREQLSAYASRVQLTVDHSQDLSGSRTWASGVSTLWVTEAGQATSNGLFTANYQVRLVAEVAVDGLSQTSVIALGVAQVESSRSCPVLVNCQPSSDDRSWVSMVGDPEGILGAVTQDGLLYNLVTHP
ncbi:MAG: hypothetical protein ACYDBQ_00335 [Thermoplasmatota archaeon]